jgi:hypothetical protein
MEKMGYWGKEIPLDMEAKNVHRRWNSLLKPTFQYSTIPFFQV